MENREITLISIYLYSHIKTYIIDPENSPRDLTRIIVAAEILSNYMRPAPFTESYYSEIHRQSIPGARLVMGAIFQKIGIDIDRFMGFTEQEQYSIINRMDYKELFGGRSNKIFWILEIIVVDLFSLSYRKAEIKDLMGILEESKSGLLELCRGIGLIKESLKVVLDRKEEGNEDA
jgi:hypothetical protein